jgi:hypothetical protein
VRKVEANRTVSALPRRLSALDASYLYNESASNPLHIGVVLIFDGHIPFDAIGRSIERRIHLLPCYRQRLAEAPFNLAHPTLEDDLEFRLENHVNAFGFRPESTNGRRFGACCTIIDPCSSARGHFGSFSLLKDGRAAKHSWSRRSIMRCWTDSRA